MALELENSIFTWNDFDDNNLVTQLYFSVKERKFKNEKIPRLQYMLTSNWAKANHFIIRLS